MGFGFFTCFLAVVVVLRCSASPLLNTDESFVSDFFLEMGVQVPSPIPGSSSSFCSWKGVFCDESKEKVIALVASGMGLSGVVPENTIGKLRMLETLDLSANDITGLSLDFWGLGSSLKSLNLSSNQINGLLPNNLANFGELESLDLSFNGFSGEIPTALGSLSSLKVLNFSGNGFEGRIPHSILGCKSLVSIDLSSNRLNGTVPAGLDDAFQNLLFLDLSVNEIGGRLPKLSGLNSINYLNLSGNMFQGSVLEVFQEPLQVIDLSNNQFQGHASQVNLSSSYSWSSLVYLDLSGNELSGEFFDDLGQARSLKHLNLAFNKFSHQNFPQLEQLSALEYLNLSKTSLVGPFPTELSKLIRLEILDLSQNYITGYVPDLSMDNLQVLDLSMNNLTGGILVPLLNKLPNMIRFNFSYNSLKFCAANFSPQTFNTAFIGCRNDCPIAVDPGRIRSKGMKHKGLKLALAISLSLFFFIAGLLCLVFRFWKRTRSCEVKQLPSKEEPTVSGPFSLQTDSTTWVADVKSATSVPIVIFDKPLLNFTFADLLTATSNFDRGTLLAEGKFGPVHRGILPGGIHVAVKVLVHVSTVTDQEAAKELERLGRIKHPNLVSLTGYCSAGDRRIAIYDYMENGNLQNLLHDLPLGVQTTEDWSTDTWEEDAGIVQNITTEGMTTWRFRHKIAVGAARALAFLHHGCYPPIVHKDVKANSIYLDSALEPRLSDFGLSKIVGADSEDEISQASPGYAPPEFSKLENVSATTRSDVYGFGVVLFELITGKKPLGDDYPEEKETTLVGWARTLVKKNQATRIIDPKIRETGSEKQMEEALRIAYLCTADLPSRRPSMQQIVGLLKDIEPEAADH